MLKHLENILPTIFHRADTEHVNVENSYGSELLAFKHHAFLARHTALTGGDVTKSIETSIKADLEATSIHNIAVLMYYDTTLDPQAEKQRDGLGPYLKEAAPVKVHEDQDIEVPTCLIRLVFDSPTPDLRAARKVLSTALASGDYRIRAKLDSHYKSPVSGEPVDWPGAALGRRDLDLAKLRNLEKKIGITGCAMALNYESDNALSSISGDDAHGEIARNYIRILSECAGDLAKRVKSEEIDITEYAFFYREAVNGARNDLQNLLAGHTLSDAPQSPQSRPGL